MDFSRKGAEGAKRLLAICMTDLKPSYLAALREINKSSVMICGICENLLTFKFYRLWELET